MTDEPKEEKKIIIDEDWKTQVEAEKEELEQQKLKEPKAEAESEVPWPTPSLALLVTTLATQTMVALGVVENPITKKSEAQLDQAKHLIDTVQMLQDKTEGNRTPEETSMFEHVLHELRMSYVASKAESGKRKAEN